MFRIQAVLLLASGCENKGVIDTGGVETGDPEIAVDVASLDFAEVAVGDSATLTAVISNVGDGTLQLYDSYTDSGDSAYVTTLEGASLAPGASTELRVVFTPTTPFEWLDYAFIESNDPVRPTVNVALDGIGLGPWLEMSPLELAFDQVGAGCSVSEVVSLVNTGNTTLEIDEIELTSGSDELVQTLWLGSGDDYWDIAPGELREIAVSYRPLDAIADQGQIAVYSNDPRGYLVAEQSGTSPATSAHTELFEQYANAIDLVFVVDNSASTGSFQTTLSDAIEGLLGALEAGDVDYRIGVITTDSPEFRGEIVTPETDNRVGYLSDIIVVGNGGSGTERGLQMLYEATNPGGDASPESEGGFMRDDARFVAVFLSDEPDQSSLSAASYTNWFLSLKDDPDLVRLNAIIGTAKSTCSATPGYNYDTAVELTGGTIYEICDESYGPHMEGVAAGSTGFRTQFSLAYPAIPETLSVRVDSLEVAGWIYDEANQAVVFEDDKAPEGGSDVRIDYIVAGECD